MARILFVLLLLPTLSFGQDEVSAARTAAGCGSRTIQFNVETNKDQHPLSQPESGKALVYVFAEPRRDPMVVTSAAQAFA